MNIESEILKRLKTKDIDQKGFGTFNLIFKILIEKSSKIHH
jgi:hypothetical protein